MIAPPSRDPVTKTARRGRGRRAAATELSAALRLGLRSRPDRPARRRNRRPDAGRRNDVIVLFANDLLAPQHGLDLLAGKRLVFEQRLDRKSDLLGKRL